MENPDAQELNVSAEAERVSFGQRFSQWWRNLFTRRNQNPTENEFLIESFTKEVHEKSKVPTKNWVGLGFGIFVMVAAVTASVFFGPALYTAITGLSAAVISGLATITTGLAATIPFVGLAIIAATVLTAFALGLYFTIDSARSLKPQIKLSEVKSKEQTLLNSSQPFVDPNQQTLLDPSQQTPITTNQDEKSNNDDQSDHSSSHEFL